MAKDSIRDFSATAGSNTDIQSVNIDENCPASGINNAIRELMVDLKNVSTGAVNLETPAADQLNVDNIRIDGNTISSTDTNGDITLDPNGTGDTIIASGNLGIGDATPIALLTMVAADGVMTDQYVAKFTNSEATTGQNYGVFVAGGSSSADESFGVRNFDSSKTYFKVRGDGNVGIGENSPAAPLHISTGASTTAELRLTSNNTGSGSGDRGRIAVHSSRNDGTAYEAGRIDIDRSSGTEDKAHILFGTNNGSGVAERMRIESSGNIIAGKVTADPANDGFQFNPGTASFVAITNSASTAGDELLFLKRTGLSGSGNFIEFTHGSSLVGSISANGSSTAYNTSSDYRLKEAVADMTGAIDRVKALAPKRFNFIEDADTTVDGFLAHEAQAVVPEAVTGTKDEVDDDGNAVMQGIDQSKLVPLLTGALQEAIAKIETLETEITALKARVTALEA